MSKTKTTEKPSELRTRQRRKEKQEGRTRRAEMLLQKEAKERDRHDRIEELQTKLEGRVSGLERRLDAHEARLQQLEQPQQP